MHLVPTVFPMSHSFGDPGEHRGDIKQQGDNAMTIINLEAFLKMADYKLTYIISGAFTGCSAASSPASGACS